MKKNLKSQVFRLLAILFLVFMAILNNESLAQKCVLPRDVIPGYIGWEGNPDTLKVYFDPTFDTTEIKAIRNAMKTWNDAGGKPKFKESSNSGSPLKIKKGDPGENAEGIFISKKNPDNKKRASAEITVKTKPKTPNLSFEELVAHELGHALGLNDTDHSANPSDLMKGKGTNGTGKLSKHDSTELKAAIASNTTIASSEPVKKKAFSPEMAILPGTYGLLGFDLDNVYPPETTVAVSSIGDDLITIENYEIAGQTLWVLVIPNIEHGSGSFYLNIDISPPPPMEPESFIGYFFTHIQPVPPCIFECPMNIIQNPDGTVQVHWIHSHTYPNPMQPLRATLLVNGEEEYLTREDYFELDLPAGDYLIQLFVDDYQVNSSSSSAFYTIPDILPSGSLQFSVPCANISFDPTSDMQPIPAGFFYPGSDTFTGTIYLEGKNGLSLPPFFDVFIQYPQVVFPPQYPFSVNIPVEMTSLNMVSSEPIQVNQNGTWSANSFFNVFVELSIPSIGNMLLDKFDPVNGTFNLEFPVHPKFTFKNVVNHEEILIYEPPEVLLFTSAINIPWMHTPGGLEPDRNILARLQTPSESSISMVSLPASNDQFVMEMNENGQVINFVGSGYNNGQWYYYPNTDWWNVWFYDHMKDDSRKKIVNSTITVEPLIPELPSTVEIVLRWSTPYWPGFPDIKRPPLPSDMPDPETEDLYITCSESFYNGPITETTAINIDNFIIEDFSPEWISIDVRGSNFIISGDIYHVCYKKPSCPPGHRMPTDFEIIVGDWLIAEPWHQWIDPRDTTRVQLTAFDPAASISQVTFFYNIDDTGWQPFYTDTDGESRSYPGEIPFSPDADGWSGYFSLLDLQANASALFGAEVLLVNSSVVWVETETPTKLDITPPSSFETNISDFEIIVDEKLLVNIFPLDANITQVDIKSEKKKEEFKKGIPPLDQHSDHRHEKGDYHCSPTAAAACLQYFADSTGDASIMGGTTPQQLVDLLAKLMNTNSGGKKGTYGTDIAEGLTKWIKNQGEKYTVRGPEDYKWKTMRNELERGQDVLTSVYFEDTIGHTMTFNSIVNRPLSNGKIKVDFMDPDNGQIEYGELNAKTGKITNYGDGDETAKIDNMVIVCPKETKAISDSSEKYVISPEGIPPSYEITLPEPGLYWIRIEVLDADGNKARKDVIVERVVNELQLQDTIITANDPPVCIDNYSVISTGGNGTVFIAETGSSVTLAASEMVKLLEGTHFQPGCVAHILIYDGDYCNPPSKDSFIITESYIADVNENEKWQATDAFFHIYPNPTTGNFILELLNDEADQNIIVEIYTMFGSKLMVKELPANKKSQFDLSHQNPGIYLIKVIQDNNLGVEKLIKH